MFRFGLCLWFPIQPPASGCADGENNSTKDGRNWQ
jgi:hypothetical protein